MPDLLLVDVANGAPTASIPLAGDPADVDVDPDGGRVYVANRCLGDDEDCANGGLTIVNPVSHETTDIAVDGNPTMVVVLHAAGVACLLDPESGAFATVDLHPAEVRQVAAGLLHSPTGVVVSMAVGALVVAERGGLAILDAGGLNVLQRIPLDSTPRHLAADPSGAHVFVATDDGIVAVDVVAGTTTGTVPVPANAVGLAVSPDARHVFVASGCESDDCPSVLSQVDVLNGIVTKSIPLDGPPASIRVDGSGAQILVVEKGTGQLVTVDAASGDVTARVAVGSGAAGANCTKKFPTCGNGIVDPGEPCDDGPPLNPPGCAAPCAPTVLDGKWRFSAAGCQSRDNGVVTCFNGTDASRLRVRQRGNRLKAKFLSGGSQGRVRGCYHHCSPATPGCRFENVLDGQVNGSSVVFTVTSRQRFQYGCRVGRHAVHVRGRLDGRAKYTGVVIPGSRTIVGRLVRQEDLSCTTDTDLDFGVSCHS